ncbi:MAG: hypothetical protein ACJA2S_005838 [Cyclobacteriaceae bacterium]
MNNDKMQQLLNAYQHTHPNDEKIAT